MTVEIKSAIGQVLLQKCLETPDFLTPIASQRHSPILTSIKNGHDLYFESNRFAGQLIIYVVGEEIGAAVLINARSENEYLVSAILEGEAEDKLDRSWLVSKAPLPSELQPFLVAPEIQEVLHDSLLSQFNYAGGIDQRRRVLNGWEAFVNDLRRPRNYPNTTAQMIRETLERLRGETG